MAVKQDYTHQSNNNLEQRLIDEIQWIEFDHRSPENDKKIIDLSIAILKASKSKGSRHKSFC